MGEHWYASPYANEGEKVPSVTTILQVVNKEYLKPWIAKVEREMCADRMWEAYEGLRHFENKEDIYKYITETSQAYKAVGKEAMSLGSFVHNCIEAYYKVWAEYFYTLEWDNEYEELSYSCNEAYMMFLSDYYPTDSIKMLSAYFKCIKEQNITILASEREVHSPLGFAGTLDLIGRVNGILSVLDIKTGEPQLTTNDKGRIPYKAIPMEYAMQVEAYRRCPDAWDIEPSGRGIIYLSKKNPGTYYFWHEDLNLQNDIDFNAFASAYNLWKRSKTK